MEFDEYNIKLDKLITSKSSRISDIINILEADISSLSPRQIYGKVVSALGTVITVYLPGVKIGDLCLIFNKQSNFELYAEVVALDDDLVKLLPFGNIENISQSCSVKQLNDSFSIKVSNKLLGKMVNGFGEVTGSITEGVEVEDSIEKQLPIICRAPDPLSRPLIDSVLVTGVKAIDLFVTCGRGQRIGIFAGPGMGKTTLMGIILRNSQVDIIVVALIGERGREVREFIDIELTGEMRSKCVLVVATSDRPPVEQVKCAYVAQTIAEYFRDQGKNVLLFVDSITRFARAQREVGLSAGEPIARSGFPPSVFLSFPRLMERAGNNEHGSITAFYTVLMEGDTVSLDPIADEVKSIIDGHIILTRKLAEQGHFPAINILTSLSRIADRIIEVDQLQAARHIRLLLSKYEELEFLIRVGEYKSGQDKLSDESIAKHAEIMKLLKQNQHEKVNYENALYSLIQLQHH
ncbi:MAG: FliI/YscN family ATPase [Proteobacteria bacterium]|jgi:type III secretion protein N (ATPase)|nr:FliI/YscN family ATPase [Pseudomonadota bacterium]